MVYHSVPDPNKTYPDHMKNFETAKYDIKKVFYSADGTLIDHVETIVTIYLSMKMDLTRDQLISQMRQQGCGFYYKGRKLHLDWLQMTPFIHCEKSTGPSCADCRRNEPRDILE